MIEKDEQKQPLFTEQKRQETVAKLLSLMNDEKAQSDLVEYLQDQMLFGRYLNVRLAAEYAGSSKSTLDKLRVYGGGPVYVKIGRTIRYDIRDLDEWLSSKRRTSTNDMRPQ